jgi:uncharacterized membrane protein YqiK
MGNESMILLIVAGQILILGVFLAIVVSRLVKVRPNEVAIVTGRIGVIKGPKRRREHSGYASSGEGGRSCGPFSSERTASRSQ